MNSDFWFGYCVGAFFAWLLCAMVGLINVRRN